MPWTRLLVVCLVCLLAPHTGLAGAPVPDAPSVAQALELAQAWLEAQHAYEQVPGVSAAIVHGERVLWIGGFGRAALPDGPPVGPDTIYRIGSLSKLFTSIALLQLRDAGRLRLDEPITTYLPWFPARPGATGKPVTVAGLLTHSSGLPMDAGMPYWSPPDFRFPTRQEFRDWLEGPGPSPWSPAGEHYQYSSVGLAVAGEVVAAVSGRPYAEYVQEKILTPLGLESTGLDLPKPPTPRLATGYGYLTRQGTRDPFPPVTTQAFAPATGFVSTVRDLARFAVWQLRLRAHGGTEVLNAGTLREMQTPQFTDEVEGVRRGLGFVWWQANGREFVGHSGSTGGHRAFLQLEPVAQLGVVLLVNAYGTDVGLWARRLSDIVLAALQAPPSVTQARSADAPALAAFAGNYGNMPFLREIAVRPWGTGLAVLGLPTGDPIGNMDVLKQTGSQTFRRVRKDGSLSTEYVFEMGADGRAVRAVRDNDILLRAK